MYLENTKAGTFDVGPKWGNRELDALYPDCGMPLDITPKFEIFWSMPYRERPETLSILWAYARHAG